ncbi:uncharacterized protein LOC123007557 [Tribolium madens]|uniref:uncharacterized protein LOC123007557 n=1 Tax=Tribolium madens TaxID=41895 RepID=UPI001CF73791|nr:uncharacterized protein LOC123007557 [Tribolium madens]
MKYPQLVSMPSAVSDWLEEQLEARGIDAVVYTRYILSLLHSDTVDVIYSDEDLHFSHLKKEVRRPIGGNRKRFRRSSSDWWKNAQADAEKLKRSAAIECLMSASEQTCGIESLIDELCEKLNEIKSDKPHVVDPPIKKTNLELQQVSPQELAKRYYAAFPPLNRNTSPTKLISLIPKWIPSPKKKPNKMKASKKQQQQQRGGGYITNRKKKENPPPPKTQDVVNLYDDLPVDIKELLDDSPSSHDVTVEMMNLANMRDTGRRGFISSGTNITSSIWTNDTTMLDQQFSSITIDNWSNESFFSCGRWSDDSGCFDDDQHNQHTLSLVKLNHDKEVSAFAEVVPKTRQNQYNPFSKIIGSELHRDKKNELEKDDDLLTSIHSHFRPINEKVDGQYADGATFLVSNTWDKINYRRTESGMYMETDYNMRKKYCEYKNGPKNMEFVLKYLVCQNDKGCQTDDVDAEVEAINRETCTCLLCDKCNNNTWNTNLGLKTDLRWQFGTTNIWSGGSVCHACLGRPPSTLQHSKLREDVSQDGDQLLSDLSTIQKSYMQESLPMTEITYDLAEFFLPKERKRRHSLMAQMDDSWSFASRLEEDCIIQMSTIPTLRSVTL